MILALSGFTIKKLINQILLNHFFDSEKIFNHVMKSLLKT